MSTCHGRSLLQSAPSLFHWYHHRLAELGHRHKLLQLGTPTCIPNLHGAVHNHKLHCFVTQMPSFCFVKCLFSSKDVTLYLKVASLSFSNNTLPWKQWQSPDILLDAAGDSCPQKLWLHKCVFLILLAYAAPSVYWQLFSQKLFFV